MRSKRHRECKFPLKSCSSLNYFTVIDQPIFPYNGCCLGLEMALYNYQMGRDFRLIIPQNGNLCNYFSNIRINFLDSTEITVEDCNCTNYTSSTIDIPTNYLDFCAENIQEEENFSLNKYTLIS